MSIENEKYKSGQYEAWDFKRKLISVFENDLDATKNAITFTCLLMGEKKDICSNSAFVANSAILNMMEHRP